MVKKFNPSYSTLAARAARVARVAKAWAKFLRPISLVIDFHLLLI